MKKVYKRFGLVRLITSTLLLLLVSAISSDLAAQSQSVAGSITDASDGSTLPGVTIIEKGTTNGTVTDFDGNYRLNVSAGATLVYSFIGYASQEISIGARSTIDVALQLDITQLQEVVIVGYGKVEKGDVTGVVSSVNTKLFNKGVINSPDQLLSGKVAGVSITTNSGAPGSQASIRIRGGTSLTASNEPLFVVDGVPIDNTAFNPGGFAQGRNPLNFINPNDIENITVLKDASAAAIYGSRGANGVIIITTKSGNNMAKTEVTYNTSIATMEFVDEVPMLDNATFRAAMKKYGSRNEFKLGDADTDWLGEIMRNGSTVSHDVSISGGLEGGGYRFSAGFQEIKGVLRKSETQRTSIGFNFNKTALNDALTIRFNTKNAVTNDEYANNQIGAALTMDPTQEVYDTVWAEFGGYFEYDNPLETKNPVGEVNHNDDVGETFRSLSNVEMSYTLPFFKSLSFNTNVALDRQYGERRRYTAKFLKSQEVSQGNYRVERYNRNSTLFEGYTQYQQEIDYFNSKLTVLGGYSYQNFESAFPSYSVDSLENDLFGLNTPSVGTGSIIVPRYPNLENRLISFYGRVNVSVDNKYILTATLRRDGSTRFGPDNRWGVFPSFALGWRMSEENFMAPLSGTLNYLKMRVGWGVTGSQEIGDYLYIAAYGLSLPNSYYQFGNNFVPTLRPVGVDPNIKWEETASFNVGFDYELFDGRIEGTLDFYQKNTSDLLYTVAFPAGMLLADRLLTNIGEVRNRGVEFEINGTILQTENLTWTVGFNGAKNNNEIIKIDNSLLKGAQATTYEVTGIAGDVGQTIQILKVGLPAYSYHMYKQKYDDDGTPVYSPLNRTEMYKDLNDDGIINEDDLRPLKQPAPEFIFGLTSNFAWRFIDASMTWRGNLGNYVYNNVSSNYGALSRLNGDNPQNIHESAIETEFSEKQLHSDYYLENGSFMKLDNITIGFTFDKFEWMRLRVYATGQNILTFTGYSGVDPEIPNGVDNNLYPRAATYIGGLSVTF